MEHSTVQSLMEIATDAGATDAGFVEVKEIPFRPEFLAACEQNTCGKYGRCWTCPPSVGHIEELIAQAQKYKYMLVFQSIGQLEDSYDIEGMEEAAIAHNALALKLAEKLCGTLGDSIRLGAGACHICPRCTKLDELPCAHPDLAVASLEAYGIAVSELAALSGLKYINGVNTVTYFGGFLFNEINS